MLLGPLRLQKERGGGQVKIGSQAAGFKAHLLSLNQELDPIIGTKPICAVSELKDLNGRLK